jgi:hypothetical protein
MKVSIQEMADAIPPNASMERAIDIAVDFFLERQTGRFRISEMKEHAMAATDVWAARFPETNKREQEIAVAEYKRDLAEWAEWDAERSRAIMRKDGMSGLWRAFGADSDALLLWLEDDPDRWGFMEEHGKEAAFRAMWSGGGQ